jgi:hypothetical protein
MDLGGPHSSDTNAFGVTRRANCLASVQKPKAGKDITSLLTEKQVRWAERGLLNLWQYDLSDAKR